jgi:hypothetical protein
LLSEEDEDEDEDEDEEEEEEEDEDEEEEEEDILCEPHGLLGACGMACRKAMAKTRKRNVLGNVCLSTGKEQTCCIFLLRPWPWLPWKLG